MKLHHIFYITPFCFAVKKGDLEICQLLLTNNKLDINIPYILKINIL